MLSESHHTESAVTTYSINRASFRNNPNSSTKLTVHEERVIMFNIAKQLIIGILCPKSLLVRVNESSENAYVPCTLPQVSVQLSHERV